MNFSEVRSRKGRLKGVGEAGALRAVKPGSSVIPEGIFKKKNKSIITET